MVRSTSTGETAMRKITFGVANSLDHFIARSDHAVDWLLWCEEAKGVSARSWQGVDTILMGRKTYEVALRTGSGGGGPSPIRTYVLSRTLDGDRERERGATVVADDVVGFVRELKQQDGGDIILMGGGEVAQPLLEADLVDEIGLNLHPVLLGSGIPLFHGFRRQIDLELMRCEPFANGCVYLHYRVRPRAR